MSLSKELIRVYKFNDYELSPEKAIQIAKLMEETYPYFTKEKITNFFDNVNKGVYGMLYKQPTCIMAMLQKYKNEPSNIILQFESGPGK